jgi:hypothetical protein
MANTLFVVAVWMLALAGSSVASMWQIERIDSTGVGQFSSLKVDRDGNLHVAYIVENGRKTLKYGFWDHALKRWFIMPIEDQASFCSLALDSSQRPHISWADNGTISGSKLRYAHFDGTWKKQAIQLNSDVIGYYTSIALDPSDNPSISFYEYRGPAGSGISVRLRVVTWSGQNWRVETVDGDNQSGKFNAIAADAQGHLHVAYGNVSGLIGGMRYAFWNGSSWRFEILEGLRENNFGYVGQASCIAVDQNGIPHVSYMNYTDGTVKYAVRTGGTWSIQAVDRVQHAAYPDRNGIALDEESHPYISYHDAGQGTVRLAYRDGSQWMREVVDGGGVGFTSSVQVHAGTIWISYADMANNGLKVARSENRDGNASGRPASAESGRKKGATPGKDQR